MFYTMNFNSVVQMVVSFGKSSVRKPWVHLTKAFLCCIGFFTCLYCLLRINTIPVRNDEVNVEVFKGFNDSVSMTMKLGHQYFGINRLQNADTTRYLLASVLTKEPETLVKWHSKQTRHNVFHKDELSKIDSLTTILEKNINGINKDSLYFLFNIKVKKDLGAIPLFTITEGLNKQYKTPLQKTGTTKNIYGGTKFYENQKHLIVENSFIGMSEKKGEENSNILLMPCDISTNYKKRSPYFLLEDISQSYYNFNLNFTGIKINRLEIDFSGATRFTGIQPQPDQTTMSGIVYTNKNKIREIQICGLQLYCQFLETSTLQSVRIFVLTAFSSLFFTLFWKCVYNFVVNVKWRRKKRKNAPGQTSA